MAFVHNTLPENYWQSFELRSDDIEFLYNYLLDLETPQTSRELINVLVEDRIRRELEMMEKRQTVAGNIYFPKESFKVGQELLFPALDWRPGKVIGLRPGKNPNLPAFEVIKVDFDGVEREFASGFDDHMLNDPPKVASDADGLLNSQFVLETMGTDLASRLEEELENNEEFVRIAGRWFPRALLVDVNIGNLNLAEAVLDMEGGGPLSTKSLMETVEMPADVNPKLAEFSLDYALWKDSRFDEVGPAGQILWHLKRLEPKGVLETPEYLRYIPYEYDQSVLTPEMKALEAALDDELTQDGSAPQTDEVTLRLIYPHWRAGTLPLSARVRSLFPTAYKAPRIRFMLVDGETREKFPGWVVRENSYVYGLREFYNKKGVIPGSSIHIRRGDRLGEVVVSAETHRPTREWIRTVLVGADGGVVLAMLKQSISTHFDDRMAIFIPELTSLDVVWEKNRRDRVPFEKVVVSKLRELAKLTPQGHVHASELYAAVNLLRRCPPGPLLALLATRPWFVHVGDLHFRLDETERS